MTEVYVLMSRRKPLRPKGPRGVATAVCGYTNREVAERVLEYADDNRPDQEWWLSTVKVTDKAEILL